MQHLVEDNGFGEHIWNVNFAKVPDLLYWCKANLHPFMRPR